MYPELSISMPWLANGVATLIVDIPFSSHSSFPDRS